MTVGKSGGGDDIEKMNFNLLRKWYLISHKEVCKNSKNALDFVLASFLSYFRLELTFYLSQISSKQLNKI